MNSWQEKKKKCKCAIPLVAFLFQVVLYSAASLSKTVFTLGNYLFTLVLSLLGSWNCLKLDLHK